MKYLKRIKENKANPEKGLEYLGQKSKLKAEADLLEVKQQISEEEQELENLRLAEESYSLTKVAEKIVSVSDLKSVLKAMEREFKDQFTE